MEPAQEKKDKKPASIEEFSKMDVRVGNIVEVKPHPESDNLYSLKVDIGTEVRCIGSGLQQYIPIEGVTGLVCVLANLKPRKLGGIESNGMILCANADLKVFEFIRPAEGSTIGERVSLEGHEELFTAELQPQLNQKKKILERALEDIKTNDDCVATFQNLKWKTAKGYVKAATLKNSNID